MRVVCLAAVLAAFSQLSAQTVRGLRLYSELQRPDPFGEIVPMDRNGAAMAPPREILSPAVARNGFFSLQVAVTAEPKSMYFLAVQSNPPDIFRWTLYREVFTRHGNTYIPDALEEQSPPYFQVNPDPEVSAPNQTTQLFLLDVWVPEDLPPGRVRLEVLVKSDTWRVAPMEVRILPAKIPAFDRPTDGQGLPPVTQPAGASARLARSVASQPLTSLRAVIHRNALQDLALSARLTQSCWENAIPQERLGAEWYLRVRDCLYREASQSPPK